ncbi:hypothetical protein N7509_001301 [Penicillium cosmopolitanum]|uniref:Uncharacterized protein n=1 Tax=Penicillium cosmopolitanum TaxID=1131564 RepID=A0A9W9WCJ8_9EURO|nr:uncharacterized protein N7509_001301 [Penicillium cosmopolitanum]KAJ5414674.1 hypothetical protein N7509_001301 [Penicillium cosmopolitanum]
MHFSAIAILCSVFALSSTASPVVSSSVNFTNEVFEKRQAVETEYEALFKTAKRCCINCDNPYARCGASENGKREAVETEQEALFGTVKRGDTAGAPQWPTKRCCILCDNRYARCSSSDKRDFVSTLEEAVEDTN